MALVDLPKRISDLQEGDYEIDKDEAFLPASVGTDATFKYPLNAMEKAANITAAELVAQETEERNRTDEDLQRQINTKQEMLIPGQNITIKDNVISSTDTIYDDTLLMEKTAYLQQQIEAMYGSLIYIGVIELATANVTQEALNARAQELGKYPIVKGYVLVDSNANDWWFDGAEWINIGYYEIATATNESKGVVKGSSEQMKVSVDLNGEMSVNGLGESLSSKQDRFNGDPMRLVKGDGSLTTGFADIRSTLDGDYSNAPAFPSVSSYMIFTSQDKFNTSILVVLTCSSTPEMYIIRGWRDKTSEKFNFPNKWTRIIDEHYFAYDLSVWETIKPFPTSQYADNILLRVNKRVRIAELLIIDLPNRPGSYMGYIPAEYKPNTNIYFFVSRATNSSSLSENFPALLTRDGQLYISAVNSALQSGSCMWSYG